MESVRDWWLKLREVKTEGSTRLTYTGLFGKLEHLKIKTRLIDERFTSVMGECVIVTLCVSSIFKVIRSPTS